MKSIVYKIIVITLALFAIAGCAVKRQNNTITPINYYDKWHYYGEKIYHPCYDSLNDKNPDIITAYGVGFGSTTSLRRTAVSDAHNNAYLYINQLTHEAVDKYNNDTMVSQKVIEDFDVHNFPYMRVDCYKMTTQNSYITLDIVVDTIIPSIIKEFEEGNIDIDKSIIKQYLNDAFRNRK